MFVIPSQFGSCHVEVNESHFANGFCTTHDCEGLLWTCSIIEQPVPVVFEIATAVVMAKSSLLKRARWFKVRPCVISHLGFDSKDTLVFMVCKHVERNLDLAGRRSLSCFDEISPESQQCLLYHANENVELEPQWLHVLCSLSIAQMKHKPPRPHRMQGSDARLLPTLMLPQP